MDEETNKLLKEINSKLGVLMNLKLNENLDDEHINPTKMDFHNQIVIMHNNELTNQQISDYFNDDMKTTNELYLTPENVQKYLDDPKRKKKGEYYHFNWRDDENEEEVDSEDEEDEDLDEIDDDSDSTKKDETMTTPRTSARNLDYHKDESNWGTRIIVFLVIIALIGWLINVLKK